MGKILFYSFFFVLVLSQVTAQETEAEHTIFGTVIDSITKKPIEFATISAKSDSALLGTTTDKFGKFYLTVPQGKYTIKFQFLSYKTQIFNGVAIENDKDFGVVSLSPGHEQLEAVNLESRERLTSVSLNKQTYRASKDPANAGGNALTVLENTPAVRVDQDGSIVIRGATATVLLDGKPVLGLNSGLDMLKSIPANTIEKVEIISQSAKYSASGGGILNIVTKKRKANGLSGSISAHGGIPNDNGASVFLNESTDNINLFTTISYNNELTKKETGLNQTYLSESGGPTGFLDQNRKDNNNQNRLLINLGSDFYLNDNNTLTASFLLNTNNKNFDTEILNDNFDAARLPVLSSKREIEDNDEVSRIETFFNYTGKFDNKGQQLSIDFKYDNTHSRNVANILEKFDSPTQLDSTELEEKKQILDNFLIKGDYTLPLSENSQIEMGLESNIRSYQNNYKVFGLDNNSGSMVPIGGYNNTITYDEDIHALYGMYSASKNNLEYSFGLRTEYSHIKIGQAGQTTNNVKDYLDWFPSVSLGYAFENGDYLALYYNKTVNRPRISQINPFLSISNSRFQSVGNLDLDPYYNHFLMLMFDTSFKNTYLTASIFGNMAKDRFLTIIEPIESETNNIPQYRRIPINSGNRNNIGLDLDLTYQPFSWLRLNTYMSPYREQITKAKDAAYNSAYTAFWAEGSALANFGGWRFLASQFYQTPIVEGLTRQKTITFTNVTLQKKLFKDQGTLSFKVTDLFRTKRGKSTTAETYARTYREVFFERQFLLSFTYLFNRERESKKDRLDEIKKDELEDKQDRKIR